MYALQSQQTTEHPSTHPHPSYPSLPSTSQHVVAQPQPTLHRPPHHPQPVHLAQPNPLVQAMSRVAPQQQQQIQQQSQQAPAVPTAGPQQTRRVEPHQLYIRNLHFYIRCLDSTPDPRGHYEMYNISLSQPLSAAYLSSLIHDPPLQKVCYAHHITRTHLSPGRALHAKTHNLLYRGPDDLIVTV